MKVSLIIRIAFIFFCLLLIVSPFVIHAGELDLSIQEIVPDEIVEVPKQMTQKEINDLFGEDPYLGQTSYLQSPDSFTQKAKSK